jgi:hypothetical protein
MPAITILYFLTSMCILGINWFLGMEAPVAVSDTVYTGYLEFNMGSRPQWDIILSMVSK